MRFTSHAGCDIHQFGENIGLSDTKCWPISNLILFVCAEYVHDCILFTGVHGNRLDKMYDVM